MSVLLDKGQGISLDKEITGRLLTSVTVGLGWVARKRMLGPDFDLDASAFGLDANDRAFSESWFVFYGNLTSPGSVILHHGDDLQGGDGAGDDEQITIKLNELPDEIVKIILPVTIFKGPERNQNFGQVNGAFIRIVDDQGQELARYDLREDFSSEDGVIFGALTRANGSWTFQAVGDSFKGGLGTLCAETGIQVR